MQNGDILFVGRGDASLDTHWEALRAKGWQMAIVTSQRRAIERSRQDQPAIIIVDGTTPRLSAERLCRQLRQCAPGSAILLLLSSGIRKPNAPYDSLLSKPFTTRRLSQRLESLLNEQTVRIVQTAGLKLDLTTRSLTTNNDQYTLTPKEFELLFLFMQSPGEVLSRRIIMESVWHTSYLGDTRTLDVHIRWLRQKIEDDPSHPILLCTRRGVGYVLRVEAT